MDNNFQLHGLISNVALIYVEFPNTDKESDLAELYRLIQSAHGKVCYFAEQKRNSADPSTVIGSGKLDEINKGLNILSENIDTVIFSCPLNATQRAEIQKNIDIEVTIADRLDLILDIFALRATTAEGKKQVELAQLSYNLATRPQNVKLSRAGAGIGTRGPGETKLETNKRAIRAKIHRLNKELEDIAQRRQLTRKQRLQNQTFTIALVGYTNAGKSTLFNRLTSSDIYADDLLFATLDTTTRRCKLPSGTEVLVCDTVGFINNLPHQLVNAFKSTLEEAAYADLILNVVDISDANCETQMAVTQSILAEIGASAPQIPVYNKCDLSEKLHYACGNDSGAVFVSAKNGTNIDALIDSIEKFAKEQRSSFNVKIPYDEYGKVISLLNKCKGTFELYDSDGMNGCESYVLGRMSVNKSCADKFLKYVDFVSDVLKDGREC